MCEAKELQCAKCGKSFQSDRKRKYCWNPCGWASTKSRLRSLGDARAMIDKCQRCGDLITRRRKGPKKFCSAECHEAHRKEYRPISRIDAGKQRPKATELMKCQACGKLVKKSQRKTCSRECGIALQAEKRKRRIEKDCEQCGGAFEVTRAMAFVRRFCSLRCACDHKKVAYLGKEYQDRAGITAARAEATRRMAETEKLKWACCDWCWRAFKKSADNQKVCGEKCSRERRTLIARFSYECTPCVITCERCGKTKEFEKSAGAGRKFCSSKCARKAIKERRVFWERSNGPCEYISLGRLVKKFSGKCVACGVRVTRYNGEYRPTDASIDHIVPLSRGGWHAWSNVQLMCVDCNSAKRDAVPDGEQLLLAMPADTPHGGLSESTGFLASDLSCSSLATKPANEGFR